jgi:hypothetical protein
VQWWRERGGESSCASSPVQLTCFVRFPSLETLHHFAWSSWPRINDCGPSWSERRTPSWQLGWTQRGPAVPSLAPRNRRRHRSTRQSRRRQRRRQRRRRRRRRRRPVPSRVSSRSSGRLRVGRPRNDGSSGRIDEREQQSPQPLRGRKQLRLIDLAESCRRTRRVVVSCTRGGRRMRRQRRHGLPRCGRQQRWPTTRRDVLRSVAFLVDSERE